MLTYPKFCLDANERDDLLAEYLPWCEPVTVDGPIEIPDCRDPHDRPFLELAISAGADALITGDKDLLVLAEASSVPIWTPAEFKARMG